MPVWVPILIGYLLEALGLTGTVLTILQAINAQVPTFAREHVQYSMEGQVNQTNLAVNDLTFGNSALRDLIYSAVADIEAQILSLTDGTTPVSLPVVPPAGYGGASSSDVASDVWNYSVSPLYARAKNYLMYAGNWAAFSSNLRYLGDENQYFQAVWHDMDWVGGASDDPPVFDPLDILSSEDIKDCLTRQNPTFTVTWAFIPGGHVRLVGSFGTEVEEWQSTFDGQGFAAIKAQLFPAAPAVGGPLWPGLANATLGSPVALDTGVTVGGPMDGVLIEITSAPTKQGYFTFDTMRSWRNVGALTFVDDDGNAEFPQTLGFTKAVYVPKSMKQATSCLLRLSNDVTGTVTPWLAAPV
jgi:hypothetical protein